MTHSDTKSARSNSKITGLAAFMAFVLSLLLMIYRPMPVHADAVVGTGTPGSCTESAFDSALTAGGVITFNCGGGAVTITLTTLKTIAVDVTINGGGLVTLSGSNTQLFQVFFNHTLILENIALANGSSTAAGALENFGVTTIINSRLSNNRSTNHAGAIYNQGVMNVISSTLSMNQTTNGGGAIYNDGGTITLTASLVSNNSVTATGGKGGAIYNSAGQVTIQRSTLTGNSAAADGGGIFSRDSTTLENVTLSGNQAVTGGGGGMYQGAGSGTLRFVTVANNHAAFGAGVYNDGGSGGTLALQNTLLANNTTGNCDGVITSLGNNLSADTNCGSFTQPGDLQNTAVSLGPLADNGGLTQTHMIASGSPAANAGVCLVAIPIDQRSVARPQGTTCDIGSVERRASDTGFYIYLPLVVR